MEGLVSELSQSAENREYALVLEEKKKTKVHTTYTHTTVPRPEACAQVLTAPVVWFSWSVFPVTRRRLSSLSPPSRPR